MPTGLGDEEIWLCPSLDDSADDLSGNGNHGTYNGGMGTVADTSEGGSRAYDFDGINDYLSIPAIGALSSWSVSAWCYFDATGSGRTILTNDKSGWNDDVLIGISPEGSTFQPVNTISATHQDSNNQVRTTVSDSTTASTGTWYHLTITSDGSALKCYVDGTLENTTSRNGADLTFGNNNVYLGNDAENTGSRRLDGRLDDIRIFDRALSDTEITHLATSRGIEGNPYQFNGLGDEKLWLCPSLNDSADDLSGNGNHGAYTGTIATVADTSNGGVRAYEIGTATGYIDLDRPSGIADVVAPLSISCWIYINGNNSMKTIWGAYQSTWSGYLYSLLRIDSDYLTYFSVSTGGAYISKQESSSYSQQTWFHIAVTMDSSGNIKFYRNGTLATTDQFTNLGLSYPLQSSVKFYLGANQAQTNSEHFEGRIDDFRWFGDVLTEDEITALASKRGYRNLTGPHPHPLTVAIEHPLG